MLRKLEVRAQAVREKKDLRVERPRIHVRIKIGEIRVLGDRLVERLPAHARAKHLHQRRLSHADIPCHRNKFFHSIPPQT
jgi:hypothetical protein